MKLKRLYKIKPDDVGKNSLEIIICKHCGNKKTFSLTSVIGYVQPRDVGGWIWISAAGNLYFQNVVVVNPKFT